MPWSLMRRDGDVVIVRDRDKKVVGRHKSRAKALRQLRALYSLEKASFGGDRSAAGRYAAEQRWKNHQKKEEEKKGRGDKSPLAQSIIEANESLAKAGCTVRTIQITKRDTELSKTLQLSVEKVHDKVSKTLDDTDDLVLTFRRAKNLMTKAVEFEDYGEYNYRNRQVAGDYIILVEKGGQVVGAMRYIPSQSVGEIPYAGSFRVAKGAGTAMFGEALKIAAKTGNGSIKIEAVTSAEGFWKSVGFQRVKGARVKRNGTYDMTIDADLVQAVAKEISS